MSGALKPWIESRSAAVAAELGFTIPAGTADRVAPPPRKGDDKDDEGDSGGNAGNDKSGANALSMSGVAALATIAASLMLLA